MPAAISRALKKTVIYDGAQTFLLLLTEVCGEFIEVQFQF